MQLLESRQAKAGGGRKSCIRALGFEVRGIGSVTAKALTVRRGAGRQYGHPASKCEVQLAGGLWPLETDCARPFLSVCPCRAVHFDLRHPQEHQLCVCKTQYVVEPVELA